MTSPPPAEGVRGVTGVIGSRDAVPPPPSSMRAPPSSCTPQPQPTNPPEAARSYSGVLSNHLIGTGQARSMLDSAESWVAAVSTVGNPTGEWMQIDLGIVTAVGGIVVQGRSTKNAHVYWDNQ